MKYLNKILIGTLLLTYIQSFAQISFGGHPYYYKKKSTVSIPFITMPKIDEAIVKSDKDKRCSLHKSLIFAYPLQVNITPETNGVWEITDDGTKLWRIGIHSSKAKSLNIIFSKFTLNNGCKVFIYNPSMSVTYGAYTNHTSSSLKNLATSPVPGDELIVELQVSSEVKDYGEIEIGQVAHDYIGIFNHFLLKDGNYGRAGACNIDINCMAGDNWQNEKKAVARLIINGGKLCTGTMVNNTKNDGTPYFLTANHCIADSNEAKNTVFCFDYESPYCEGPDGSITNTISGSMVKSTSANLDFTLLELIDKPPYAFDLYYAGWSYNEKAADSTASIHHPLGDVKKISFDHDSTITATFTSNEYDSSAHWLITNWERGTTQGGSSGSPLFNQDHQIVGTLTGGEATCENSINDYYGKFTRFWDDYSANEEQLKCWLDPESSGLKNVYAYIPETTTDFFSGITKNKSELEMFDTVVFTDASVGDIALYKWDFGSDAIPRYAFSKGPHSVIYYSPGIKSISLEIINGKKSSTITDVVTSIPVDINQLLCTPFLAYPNPSNGWVYIEQTDSQPNYELAVYNMMGEQLYPDIKLDDKKYAVDFTGFSSGVYIIKMKNNLIANDKIRRLTVVIY